MSDRIFVTQPSMPSFEEYCQEIKKIWESHWLTNMGAEHEELQQALETYLDCPHIVLYTNGHLALENIIASMNFPAGSEVITTPFTFASTTHAIVRNGLVPVFCDIDPENYTIDTNKIEALITDKTIAILPVHVYGNMCDIESIDRIAKANNLKVIYDAAHAFGVKYKGISSANFGDASMFSFHATKVFNTIEGGAACFQNGDLVQTMNDLKNFGIRDEENIKYIGGNAKMNEFQAAMGICNLRHIDEEIHKRKQISDYYRNRFENIPGIKVCKPQMDVQSNYAYFPVIFDNFSNKRDVIYEKLKKKGISSRKYFYPLTNSFDCYRYLPSAGKEKTPVASYIADRVLTIPLYSALSLADADRICDLILE